MNAVATHARALKMLVISAVVLVAGWVAFQHLSESIRFDLFGAVGGVDLPIAPAMAAGTQPGCELLNGTMADEAARPGFSSAPLHSLDLQVLPEGRTSSDIGNATVSVQAEDLTRNQIRWSADIGIDALILSGPRGASVRRFDRERFHGRNALKTESSSTGTINKIIFCYDFELSVNKDVNPEFTRVYDWKLRQSVEPARWQLAAGHSGTSTYRIQAARDHGTAKDWRVRGTITIDNLTPLDATLRSVRDQTSDGIVSEVDCGVPLPGYVLKSGQSLTCEYRSELPDAATRETRATVQTLGTTVRGSSARARIDFGNAQIHEVADSVLVHDSSGRSWTFQASGAASYQRVFRCEDDAGLHPWAARIDGNIAGASAVVTVDCTDENPEQSTARRILP